MPTLFTDRRRLLYYLNQVFDLKDEAVFDEFNGGFYSQYNSFVGSGGAKDEFVGDLNSYVRVASRLGSPDETIDDGTYLSISDWRNLTREFLKKWRNVY